MLSRMKLFVFSCSKYTKLIADRQVVRGEANLDLNAGNASIHNPSAPWPSYIFMNVGRSSWSCSHGFARGLVKSGLWLVFINHWNLLPKQVIDAESVEESTSIWTRIEMGNNSFCSLIQLITQWWWLNYSNLLSVNWCQFQFLHNIPILLITNITHNIPILLIFREMLQFSLFFLLKTFNINCQTAVVTA